MVGSNKNYKTIDDLPQTLTVFPLKGALLLPGGYLPLNIFEPRYLTMIDHALANNRLIGMVQPSFGKIEEEKSLCKIGCAGRLISFSETGDGRYHISLIGISRFEIEQEDELEMPFRTIKPNWQPYQKDLLPDQSLHEEGREELLDIVRQFMEKKHIEADWAAIKKAKTEFLVNALSMMAPYGPAEKQALLEAKNIKKRAETLITLTQLSLASSDRDEEIVLQ